MNPFTEVFWTALLHLGLYAVTFGGGIGLLWLCLEEDRSLRYRMVLGVVVGVLLCIGFALLIADMERWDV